MSLKAGARLGPYEVISAIGAGGMGEVYRARDTNLGRTVAIKILPEAFALDSERRARFEREAQLLASLHHPHIALIFGLEESNGRRALILELVDGPTLADRIAQGPLPVDEAVSIAGQIASALEAAHEGGIIHRDLKPANVKLTGAGAVKVLDFGLAKTYDTSLPPGSDPANSPTFLDRETELGVVMGTAGYMAPEQARGRRVDKRADVWALGCTLFEMLTGRRLFDGETVSDTIAAVLTRPIPWDELPRAVPVHVRHLLERCLDRDARTRLRDIGEARIALTEARDTVQEPAAPARTRDARRSRASWIAIGAAVVGAVLGAAIARQARTAEERPVRRFAIATPTGTRPVAAAISPDGRAVAFIASDRMWVQWLHELDARELPGSDGARSVFWSPDSAWVGFQARGEIWKAAASGGTPIAICRSPGEFSTAAGVAWLADDRLIFTTGNTGLYEVSANGGTPRLVLAPEARTEADFHDVSALPDGRGVLFVAHLHDGLRRTVDVFDGRTRTRVREGLGTETPVWTPEGRLLYHEDRGVWAVPFSLSRLTTSGEPVMIATGATRPSVSADGTLVMVPGGALSDQQLTWVDGAGRTIETLGQRGSTVFDPRLSPDGRQIVATVGTGSEADIWVYDMALRTETRLTFDRGANGHPAWSPDGRFIVYRCAEGVCARRADGNGPARTLVPGTAYHPAFAPDGLRLIFSRNEPDTGLDLLMVTLDRTDLSTAVASAPTPLVVAPGGQRSADVSPDGRYVAYDSDEVGGWSSFVTRFPSGEGKWQISTGLGYWPRWSSRGDRVFFLDELRRIVEADVDTGAAFAIRTARPVVSGLALGMAGFLKFDRSLDGTRFVFPRAATGARSESQVLAIENWFAELERLSSAEARR